MDGERHVGNTPTPLLPATNQRAPDLHYYNDHLLKNIAVILGRQYCVHSIFLMAWTTILEPGAQSNSSSSRSIHAPEVRARLESGPRAASCSPMPERNGSLQLHLHGYHASLMMSTLRNLALFLEDDSASQALPVEVSIRDTHINLQDDSHHDNPSNGEPSLLSLHVDSLTIHRRDDGSFAIGVEPAAETKPKTTSLIDSSLSPVPETVSSVCRIPKATQTQTPPSSPAPSTREKMLIEENECLKVELSRTKMALAEAQMEKDSLLHRMKNLKLNTS